MEHERTGLQGLFEFVPAECDGLVVIVRTDDFKVEAFAHSPLMITPVPGSCGHFEGIVTHVARTPQRAGRYPDPPWCAEISVNKPASRQHAVHL
jgi:hypothetical protein